MAEFKIAHLVSELLQLFGIEDSSGNVCEKLLLKSIPAQSIDQPMPHGIVKKLAQMCQSPKEFISKYDTLRATKGKVIDSLVIFLSKTLSDEKTKQQLMTASISKKKKISLVSASQITANDLIKLKEQLHQESLKDASKSLSNVCIPDLAMEHKAASVAIPKFPSWVTTRPYLTMNFVIDSSSSAETASIAPIPVSSQENCLIQDLLFCLEGVEGEYIHCLKRQSQISFTISSGVDKSLGELTNRILPLCSNYSTVVEFIEERSLFKYGLVNHALCAALRSLLKDYFVLVAQLEHQHQQGSLTLQLMWFYLQPTMLMMENLAIVLKTIAMENCHGGSVLSVLHNKTSSSGNAQIQELLLHLTQAASVPYFEILEKWIYQGLICDPYMEFLIEDNEVIHKEEVPVDYSNDFWDMRYTICRERMPTFLEKVSDTILRVGKYLNVLHQCGQKVQIPQAEKLSYSIQDRRCIDSIEKACKYASETVLTYLMKEKHLIEILRSVRNYFLLNKGDFIIDFMDIAKEELGKSIGNINPTRLQSLVELALRTSSANHDIYKDNLKVELLPYDLIFQMSKILSIETKAEDEFKSPADLKLSGLASFTFDYEVKWPISLILNRKAIACYQMLFRQLFLSKHVEKMLFNVWRKNKSSMKLSAGSRHQQTLMFSLGARMLYFVLNLEYYMMSEVLEPEWNMFVDQLQNVTNVEDVLKCHVDLLDLCLKECMLTNPQLLGLVNDLLKTCLSFSEFSMNSYNISETGVMTKSAPTIPTEEPTFEEFEKQKELMEKVNDIPLTFEKYHQDFTSLIVRLLNGLKDLSDDNYDNKLLNMLHRLDFNGYYNCCFTD